MWHALASPSPTLVPKPVLLALGMEKGQGTPLVNTLHAEDVGARLYHQVRVLAHGNRPVWRGSSRAAGQFAGMRDFVHRAGEGRPHDLGQNDPCS